MKALMRDMQDKWKIIKLQNCILNIAEYIHQFCKENGITYCLMGGSALGAIRHQGFIPWDDDLDIFMTPDNYEKFRTAFLERGDKENFYLQQFGNLGKQNGLVSRAKLRMNNTSLIEESIADKKIHQGVFVDIFILHACPDNKIKQNWQYFWARYVVIKNLANNHYSRRGKLAQYCLSILNLLPHSFLINYALRQVPNLI